MSVIEGAQDGFTAEGKRANELRKDFSTVVNSSISSTADLENLNMRPDKRASNVCASLRK